MDATDGPQKFELVPGILYRPTDFLKRIGSELYGFITRVDYVLIAPCAFGRERRHAIRLDHGLAGLAGMPPIWYARGPQWANGERLEFFEQVLWDTRFNQVVLLVPECCGPYSEGFMLALRAKYPDAMFVTADIAGGHHGRPIAEHVGNDLQKAGLLKEP